MASTALRNFRSYCQAVELNRRLVGIKIPSHLRDQLLRAASSIVLNLAEGSAKPTVKDRQRFYSIALGSLREVQACLDLTPAPPEQLVLPADQLGGGCLYRLTRSN